VPIVAVIDTNVWVSAFLNPDGFPARLIAAGQAHGLAIVQSLPLLEELLEVLCRPRIMRVRRTSVPEAQAYVRSVAAVARLVSVPGTLQACRDPDDNALLETAIAGEATHIVSRDEDVVRDQDLMRQFQARGIQVLTVSRFLAVLDEGTEVQQP
jgi:putative PIN family toxin of toxin-antitoxin system